ncbi:MAG: hemolysin family protein [candidate division Zixibacteria bacterium]|nr:hemolysin family protein [candidate division Zixibacteria bacterium]
MDIWLYSLFILWSYLSAYVVTLYSLAVYLDPEEVETLLPHISRRRRQFIIKLAGDPRVLMQIATIYKSFALMLLTLMSSLLVKSIATSLDISSVYFYFGGLAMVWVLYIAFVEYMPRQASRRVMDTTRAPRYLWLVTTIYVIFYPVVAAYRAALKRIKAEEATAEEQKEDVVERAIETLADQAGISEVIVEEDEKKMIGQIFLLDQTVVREIMVPRIDMVGIDRTMSFREIQQLIARDGYSRYPVFEETIDRIVGIMYVKDLFNSLPEPGEMFDINKYLRQAYFIPESKVIGDLLREFKATKLHIAVVVDEYGGVSGLVTLEDILEEIVGEIQDEHDVEEAQFIPQSDGRYLVDGAMLVEELQDALGTDYEQGDYDTVGGLLYYLIGGVPKPGLTIAWHDLEFEILKLEGQRIKRVKVWRRIPRTTP